MKNKIKIEEGQTVWVKTTGRYETPLLEDKVQKVGKNIFTLENSHHVFKLSTLKNNGGDSLIHANYPTKVYLSLQEFEDESIANEKLLSIRKYFSIWSEVNLTCDQLKRIDQIINE